MKYTKKVWIPALVIVLLIVIIVGFIFMNSISKPDKVLADEAQEIQTKILKSEKNNSNFVKAPDMSGIETDAMLKDIKDNGSLSELGSFKAISTVDNAGVLKSEDVKQDKNDDIDDFVKSLNIGNEVIDTKPEIKAPKKNTPEKYYTDDMPVGIEKGADLELDSKSVVPAAISINKVGVEKGADFKSQVLIKEKPKVNLTETYKTPYFTVNFPAADWGYAEGKEMNLPSFVDIPKKTAVATVEFFNKKNGNSIFLHISHSGGADLNKMTPSETRSYLRYIYNDSRIEKVPIEYINNMRFAVLKFVPRNNKLFLVKQYLTTKNNYLYCITFVEKKTTEINQKMINEILGSMLLH